MVRIRTIQKVIMVVILENEKKPHRMQGRVVQLLVMLLSAAGRDKASKL